MSCEGPVTGDFEGMVLENRLLDGATGILHVRCPGVSLAAEPGQFVMVRPGTSRDPFLGRPLAVAWASGDSFGMVYRVVGRGTALLAGRKAGAGLQVRGPVGRGFFTSRGGEPLPSRVVLAGGSVGAAPLLFAYQRLGPSRISGMAMGVSGSGWEEFAAWLAESFPGAAIFSDDGSIGRAGTALEGLPREIGGDTEIWACGPEGMLRALAARYPGQGGRIRVALEARMACGMGGCLGCVIPTTAGNRRVCADGPVFAASEVKWHELSRDC